MAGTITMYGADWCGDCTRAKALLDREGVAYTYVDVEADDTGAATCGGVRARLASGTLEVEGDGTPDERLRAVVAACWAGVDRGEDPAAVEQQVWDELAPDAH